MSAPALRLLTSYIYARSRSLGSAIAAIYPPGAPVDVFLDSGAFTAHSLGKTITRAEYQAYIAANADHLTAYANLDVIGDAEATWRNQQAMEADGFHPIPVIHAGAGRDVFARYLDRYPYIALGGLVGTARKARPWLVRAFQLAQGRAVYHGFGVTSWTLLRQLPWYSVDSSSWLEWMRYGRLPIFDAQRGVWHKVDLADHRALLRAGGLMARYGIDPGAFTRRYEYDRDAATLLAVRSYQAAEAWLRAYHGPITIPGRPDAAPGKKIYLVDRADRSSLEREGRLLRAYLAPEDTHA